jgi:hypothetical protein
MLNTDDTFILLGRDEDSLRTFPEDSSDWLLSEIRAQWIFMFGLMSVVVCIGLSLWQFYSTLEAFVVKQQFSREGRVINVTVMDCHMYKSKYEEYPILTYEYSLPNAVFTGEENVNGSSCSQYPEGLILKAQYLFSAPSHSRIVQTDAARSPYNMFLTVTMTFAFGAGLYVLRDLRRGFRVFREHSLIPSHSVAGQANDSLPQHATSITWWFVMSTIFSIVFCAGVGLGIASVGVIFTEGVTIQSVIAFVAYISGMAICYIVGRALYRNIGRAFYALRNRFYAIPTGVFLEGEVTAVSGYSLSRTGAYYVRIWYQFMGPSKKMVKGYVEAQRQDLKKNLPAVGTPITVLYGDEHNSMMV